jgi:hypothetical protein
MGSSIKYFTTVCISVSVARYDVTRHISFQTAVQLVNAQYSDELWFEKEAYVDANFCVNIVYCFAVCKSPLKFV